MLKFLPTAYVTLSDGQ